MRKAVLVATVVFALASMAILAFVGLDRDSSGLGMKRSFWCREYLNILHSKADTSRLLAWADNEVFRREFGEQDFRVKNWAGPSRGRRTLAIGDGALRLPGWMPDHYEIQAPGDPGSRVSSIFITGGKYQGLVVVRDGWDAAFDGANLTPDMILARNGRVGLVCYVD